MLPSPNLSPSLLFSRKTILHFPQSLSGSPSLPLSHVWCIHFMTQYLFFRILLLGIDDLCPVANDFTKWYIIVTFYDFDTVNVSTIRNEELQITNIIVDFHNYFWSKKVRCNIITYQVSLVQKYKIEGLKKKRYKTSVQNRLP